MQLSFTIDTGCHQGQRLSGKLGVRNARIVVVGAGIAGLSAAVDLAGAGFEVILLERSGAPGGKIREVQVAGRAMDAGPTVFTMPGVFEHLFQDAGDDFSQRVRLVPANILARHAWNSREQLDLFADPSRSAQAIGDFAGKREAQGFLRFVAQSQRIFRTLDPTFMRAPRPTPLQLAQRIGFKRWPELWNIQPFNTLWRSTGRYFRDPRLRQLFARYATYCGSSPFAAPATLMLIAHVEQAGVWYVAGGMHQLAVQLAQLAIRKGVTVRYNAEVRSIEVGKGRVSGIELRNGERLSADAVICNADNNALACGTFGAAVRSCVGATRPAARSLSAVTWNLLAKAEGFELAHHSVFFSSNYRGEFNDIFRRRRLPGSPSIYICAQDRCDDIRPADTALERLFVLMNAPATGDFHFFDPAEIDACKTSVFEMLESFGLRLKHHPSHCVATSPSDFNWMYPQTGGALYGPASHGWTTSFKRAGSRSTIPGLYLAGGSTHPGPGVPMAATSGRLAAACVKADYASIVASSQMAMSGGISMP
jgi:1-hydroxycarotenoid 3,4-desaturase